MLDRLLDSGHAQPDLDSPAGRLVLNIASGAELVSRGSSSDAFELVLGHLTDTALLGAMAARTDNGPAAEAAAVEAAGGAAAAAAAGATGGRAAAQVSNRSRTSGRVAATALGLAVDAGEADTALVMQNALMEAMGRLKAAGAAEIKSQQETAAAAAGAGGKGRSSLPSRTAPDQLMHLLRFCAGSTRGSATAASGGGEQGGVIEDVEAALRRLSRWDSGTAMLLLPFLEALQGLCVESADLWQQQQQQRQQQQEQQVQHGGKDQQPGGAATLDKLARAIKASTHFQKRQST